MNSEEKNINKEQTEKNEKIEKVEKEKTKKEKKTKEEKKQAKEEKKKIKEEKKKAKKEKKETNKFVQTVKRKWLIDGSRTLSLVLLILAAFLGINTGMKVLDLTPIDLTQEKLYTLTDESKERVKDIDKDVNLYFVGYPEDNADLALAKQYKDANEKIVAEAVDAESRPDLVEKYGIQDTGSSGIIVECGDRSKVLTASDLVTYDSTTYETISIAEEKLTSAIISVTTDNIPKVYFLEGYSDFTLDYNMYYLNAYLQNEVTEVDTLNLLSTGNVPDDCDTLVITSPSQDFSNDAKTAIYSTIYGKQWGFDEKNQTKQDKNIRMKSVFDAFKGVKEFISNTIQETKRTNSIESISGKIRVLPKVSIQSDKKRDERKRWES